MTTNVSVVIPLYRSEAWIEETLESVLAQTYPRKNVELILIDDASPDNSCEKAREVLRRHSAGAQFIQLESNVGPGAARNIAWRHASSEWVQFLDADDLLAPNKLAAQLNYAASAKDDVAVIYSPWQNFAQIPGSSWRPVGEVHRPEIVADCVADILREVHFGYVGMTLVRRTWLERVGGFKEERNVGEDINLMLRLAMAGGRFRFVPFEGPAFYYRNTPGSAWTRLINNPEAMRNLAYTFRSAELHLRVRDGELSCQARRAVARRYARHLEVYRQNDAEMYRVLVRWTRELGVRRAPDGGRAMAAVSIALGYHNALRVRAMLRDRLRLAS